MPVDQAPSDPPPVVAGEQQQGAEKYQSYSNVKSHLNWYFELEDSTLHQLYQNFYSKRDGSLGFMYYVSTIQTLLGVPAMFVSMYCDFTQTVQEDMSPVWFSLRKVTGVLTFLCMLISCWSLWVLIFLRAPSHAKKMNFIIAPLQDITGYKLPNKQSSGSSTTTPTIWTWSNIFYVSGQVYFTLLYVRKVFRCFAQSPTPDYLACFVAESFLQNFIIDPYLMIIVPVLTWILVADVSIGVFWCTYGINLLVLLILEIYVSKYDAVSRLLMTIFLCLFFVIDIQMRNVAMFFSSMDLKQALKEVKRMEEENRKNEMRNMIANVAHDMKTPLASFVTGMDFIQHVLGELKASVNAFIAQATEEQSATFPDMLEAIESIEECLTNVRNTNSFMLMTINRCIDYTKASKGLNLVPKYETIQLCEALQLPLSCMSNIQQRVELRLSDISETICSHIITDKQWLQENILCLLSNAVKFTTDGDVTISVTMQHADDVRIGASADNNSLSSNDTDGLSSDPNVNSLVLYFQIQDSGVGIPEDAVHRLFKPFRQIQRFTGGTGLGLYSLAKRIEAMNGTYGAKQRDDGKHGSVFWFTIPYRPDAMSAKLAKLMVETKQRSDGTSSGSHTKSSSQSTPSTMGNNTPVFRKLHILVVDDSPAIIKLTTMLLKRIGHTTSTAENGLMATKMVADLWNNKQEQYDVILMDLQMPVMDGLEATTRIRDYETQQIQQQARFMDSSVLFKHQFVIAMSANSDSETSDSSLESGADTFMCKPFNVQAFNETISNFL